MRTEELQRFQMATSFDPQIFQAAILEVAEATKAAVKLAQTVQQTDTISDDISSG